MATLTFRQTGHTVTRRETIATYLNAQGVIYDRWDIDRLQGRLRSATAPGPYEPPAILDLYDREIADLKRRRGYLAQDVVVLNEQTPDLDLILEKFRREHHHPDDEVRFVVDGSGIFTIRWDSTIVDVTMEAGDLLVVPARTRHWFDLTAERTITCVRIFKNPAGWVAIYDPPARSPVHQT